MVVCDCCSGGRVEAKNLTMEGGPEFQPYARVTRLSLGLYAAPCKPRATGRGAKAEDSPLVKAQPHSDRLGVKINRRYYIE